MRELLPGFCQRAEGWALRILLIGGYCRVAVLGNYHNGAGVVGPSRGARNRVPVSSRELLAWGLSVECWHKALYRDLSDTGARGI